MGELHLATWRALPAPATANGHAAEGPCSRPACRAIKKHLLLLARDADALRAQVDALARERDALRAEVDAGYQAADWAPVGGTALLDSLTPTERRLCECLLLAGTDSGGAYRAARYDALLRHAWPRDWSLGATERHLIRVVASRLRRKLRGFGWDVRARQEFGLRLVPWDGPRPTPAPRRPAGAGVPVSAAERARILALWGAGLGRDDIARALGRGRTTVGKYLARAREEGVL